MKQILFLLIFVFTAIGVGAQENTSVVDVQTCDTAVTFELPADMGGQVKITRTHLQSGSPAEGTIDGKHPREWHLGKNNRHRDEWKMWLTDRVLPDEVKGMLDMSPDSKYNRLKIVGFGGNGNVLIRGVADSDLSAEIYLDSDFNVIDAVICYDHSLAGKLTDEQLLAIYAAILKERVPDDVKKTIEFLPATEDYDLEFHHVYLNLNMLTRRVEYTKKEDSEKWTRIKERFDKTSGRNDSTPNRKPEFQWCLPETVFGKEPYDLEQI